MLQQTVCFLFLRYMPIGHNFLISSTKTFTRSIKNLVWVNYLFVGILTVPTTVLVSRAVLPAAAADRTAVRACTAAAAAATALAAPAAAAMLLPKLPYFFILMFIFRLVTISRGSSGRRRRTGEGVCTGLYPEVCNSSLYFAVNPFLMVPCLLCNLQKQFKELWIYSSVTFL